jgi:hypothetical protein
MIVDQLQRRNQQLIARIAEIQASRDPLQLNGNVQLLRELDGNLHKILALYQEFGMRIA